MIRRFDGSKRLNALLIAGGLCLLALLLVWQISFAQSASGGERLFQQKCSGCHSIGGGDLAGPDLAGVTQRRDQKWLTDFIAAPDKVLASGDPIASELYAKYGNIPMPNLGLSVDEVTALIEYIGSQGGSGTGGQAPQASELPAGDPARGQALFMGEQHFENGGPPCMGCHNVGSIGLLGGGSLGPDLTDVSARYPDAGLAASLSNIPWPAMKPIYTKHLLTPEEQTDLRAFLETTAVQRKSNREFAVIGISLTGFMTFAGLFGLVYRRRSRSARKNIVE